MTWLRSTAFHMSFWVWTLTLGFVALPTLLLPVLARTVAMVWVDGTLWLLRMFCGLVVEVRGSEHILDTPAIYAAKHQSTLDTLMLWKLLNGPAFILKWQLLVIPVFGWYLARTRPIAINRAAGSKMLPHIVKQGKVRVAGGRRIIIFPEGTRTKPGADTRYKMAGVSVLYEALDVPVVPVALNTGLFWPKRQYVKRSGVAVIEFLPPIASGRNPDEMAKPLQETIDEKSRALL